MMRKLIWRIASPQATRPQFQEPEIGSNSVNYSGDDCGDIENLKKCPTCGGYHAGGCHRAAQPAAGTTLEWTAEEIENFHKQASQPQPEPSEHLIRAMASRPSDGLTDDITMEEAMDIAQGLQDVAEGRTKPFEQIEKELSEPTTPQAERPHFKDEEILNDGVWHSHAALIDGLPRSFTGDVSGCHICKLRARAVAPVETPNYLNDPRCPACHSSVRKAKGTFLRKVCNNDWHDHVIHSDKVMGKDGKPDQFRDVAEMTVQTRLTAEQFWEEVMHFPKEVIRKLTIWECEKLDHIIIESLEAFRDKSESQEIIGLQSDVKLLTRVLNDARRCFGRNGTIEFDCLESENKGLREEIERLKVKVRDVTADLQNMAIEAGEAQGLLKRSREELTELRAKLADWQLAAQARYDRAETAEGKLVIAQKEIERLRFKLYYYPNHKGVDHTTACSIWREDGQGHTKGFDGSMGPCNCGALINFERRRAEAAEAKLDQLLIALGCTLGGVSSALEVIDAKNAAIEAAEAEAAALRERERWIPVEEKLPEDGTSALIFVPDWEDMYLRYRVAWINYDEASPEWIFDGHAVNGVTHWKALSAAPERS